MPRNWFALSLVVLLGAVLSACGKPGSTLLGNGSYSVVPPEEVSMSCATLQHASDCNNYNVPGSIEGMEVRMCQGESKNTKFLMVTGQHPANFEPDSGENTPDSFVMGWSRCLDGKIKNSQPITIEGKSATDYVLSTPMGEAASRVYVDKEYSVMVLAAPKYSGSKDEIDKFVNSLRPVAGK